MAQLNLRIDDNLKKQGEQLFSSLGLTFSVAVSAFVAQSVREGGIPFPLTTKTDPFYSESNMAALRQGMREIKEGKTVTKTLAELEAIAAE